MSLTRRLMIGTLLFAGAYYLTNNVYANPIGIGVEVDDHKPTCEEQLSEARQSSDFYEKLYGEEVIASDARYNKMLTEKDSQLRRAYGIGALGVMAIGLICFQLGCNGRNSEDRIEPLENSTDETVYLLEPKD